MSIHGCLSRQGDPSNILQAVRSMGIKTQSMPFGSLSRATLDEAKSLLGDIKVAIEELHLVGKEKSTESIFKFSILTPDTIDDSSRSGWDTSPISVNCPLSTLLRAFPTSLSICTKEGAKSRTEHEDRLCKS